MTKVVLEIPNQKDLELILSFARRLKANVIQVGNSEKELAIFWLEKLAQFEPFDQIADPVDWQRNNRKERELLRT